MSRTESKQGGNRANSLDICVLSHPTRRWRALRWTTLIAQSKYEAIREVANDVYYACDLARCGCPIVDELGGGGLQIAWENQNRTLYARIVPGRPVRHMTKVTAKLADTAWLDADPDRLDAAFFRLGLYISGVKASDCLKGPLCPRDDEASSA